MSLLSLQLAGYGPFSSFSYIKKKCFINHRCLRFSDWDEKAIYLPPGLGVLCARRVRLLPARGRGSALLPSLLS